MEGSNSVISTTVGVMTQGYAKDFISVIGLIICSPCKFNPPIRRTLPPLLVLSL